jgi:hypothetical protein
MTDDPKIKVISVRLTPAVHAALTTRATNDRQPLTRMAALLIEDGLARQAVASAVPLATPALSAVRVKSEIEPFFRQPVKKKGRRS